MTTLSRLFITGAACLPLLMTAGCNLKSNESEAAEHISRSQTYADQGQYRSAFLEVRNALQQEPGNLDHVLTLARLYLDVGAGQRASDTLEPWQAEHADRVALPLAKAYILQGKHLSATETLAGFTPASEADRFEKQRLEAEAHRLAGDDQTALSQFRTLLKTQPDNTAVMAGLAKTLIHEGETVTALDQLEHWRSAHGDQPELLYLQGLIHYRLNELEPAANALTDGLAALPQSDIFLPVRRQTLGLLARTLTEQGNLTEAQVYNKILTENTDNELRQNTEAALKAIGEGNLDTARLTLEDLIEKNPDNDLINMLLGAVKVQQGNVTEGESLLSQSVDAETSPTPFIRLSTMAQIDKGKRDQALSTLERALLARPTDVDLLAMHGLLALTLPNKAADGVVSLNKALQIDSSRTRLRMALAQYYVQQDQLEQALGQLRAAFAETPADWPITNYYVQLLVDHDHQAEAEEVKDTLLQTRAKDANAMVLAGLTEFRLGQVDSAVARLKQLARDKPDWAVPHRALAAIYQDQDQTDKAIDAYLAAAERTPDRVDALQRAGRLYAGQHDPEAVIEWLLTLGDRHPDLATNADALAAQIRVQQRQFETARDILGRHPGAGSPLIDRVTAQLLAAEADQAARRQDWDQARAKVAEAIDLEPDQQDYHLLLVRIATAQGNADEARQLLTDVESKFGSSAPVVLTRSLVLRQSDGEQAAYDYLYDQWQHSPDPDIAPELVRLARVTQAETTETIINGWIDARPRAAQPLIALADLQLSQGDAALAEASYRKALSRQPNSVPAMNNLAWLIRDKAPDEALKLSAEAARLAPRSAAVVDTHGWILHLAGQQEEAVTVLRQASRLAPDNPDIAEHLKTVEAAR